MNLVGFCSVTGAPGVTTTALLIAGAMEDPVVLAEADLSGGVLAVRYGLGREPGLTTLAAAGRAGSADVSSHAQDAGGVPVLVGPDSAAASGALWRRAEASLGQLLSASPSTIVIDLGRACDTVPLASWLSQLVILVRPIPEQLVALSHQLPVLRQLAPEARVATLLVGDGDYRPADISGPLQIEVLGALPEDRRAAEAFTTGGWTRALARSRLLRSATAVASTIDGTTTRRVAAGASQ